MTNAAPAVQPKGRLWTGRILSGLAVLFMLFDATIHVLKPSAVVEALAQLGYPLRAAVPLGIIELVLIALYLVPRTSVFGAILLTGYLGGAVAIQMRAGSPVFETVFPVLFGVIVWAGVYLRQCGLRRVFPLLR